MIRLARALRQVPGWVALAVAVAVLALTGLAVAEAAVPCAPEVCSP